MYGISLYMAGTWVCGVWIELDLRHNTVNSVFLMCFQYYMALMHVMSNKAVCDCNQ